MKCIFLDVSCNFDIWYCGWEILVDSWGFVWIRKFGLIVIGNIGFF